MRNSSLTMPATVAKEPIRINNGITARVKEFVVLKGIAASCAVAASMPTVR